MDQTARIYVAGGEHLIVHALLDSLAHRGFVTVSGGDRAPDPTNPEEVRKFFARFRPEYVVVAGGDSGGIGRNTRYPAKLMLDNLAIATSVIPAAYEIGVSKLLYVASSCGYPKACAQSMREEDFFSGPVEETSEFYAAAKFAGVQLCRAYRKEHGAPFVAAIPANEFGPDDNFEPDDAHVIPALIRRMHEAKLAGDPNVTVWGSGTPIRDFIYAPDLAEALLLILERYDDDSPINVGSGAGHTIAEVADAVRRIVGFEGELDFDDSRPDGMPRKVLDTSRLRALGWSPKTELADAIAATYDGYKNRLATPER